MFPIGALLHRESRRGERLTLDPWRRWRFSVGTDVIAPVLGIPIEADSKSKVPLIRVAPVCPRCLFWLTVTW